MSDLVLGLIAGLLFLVVASPLRSASIFVLFRPLMQAYSVLHIPFLGFPTTTIHSGLLLLATLFSLFRKGSRLIIRHIVILYILVAYAMISFTKAADKAEAFTGLVKILTALALYVLVYNGIKNYKGGVTFLKACAYSAVIPTVFGIAQRMTGKWALSYDIYGGNRITSVIGIANAYGIYLSFVTIPVIILILLKVRRKTNVVILVL
ncbi:MAG: hypothetical protein KKC99_07300, partial [Proteobacteria bacterium]|nr:hypothetical protein [Pseudomonadota bacterium]